MNDDAKLGGSEVSSLDRSFAAAIAAVERSLDSAEAWDHLEELAEKLNRAEEVARLYGEVIERKLAPDLFEVVGQRAVAFHDAWFGETPERITELLGRITEIDPGAAWAFERLTVMLTSAGRWDDLLAAYDRTIARTLDRAQKRRLLDDAAQAAKDFADQPDRAADYLRQLVDLEPDNAALQTSLERLLERGRRFGDLVALWEARLSGEDAAARRSTRMRIARCWLAELAEPQRAVDVLRDLLVESPGQLEACRLLEEILGRDEAELTTRRQALSLLRKHYLVADRPEDVVRVLEAALGFVEQEERRPIHRELATRLAILGRDEAAMAQYRALLLDDPTDADARKQLRQLAGRSGRHDLHAEALTAAAASDPTRQATVLLDAAHVHQRELSDPEGAIALYRRVLETADDPSAALAAAHALDELLAQAEAREERLAVLERLATLERSASVRRSVLAEAARIAEALGDEARALASWQLVLAEEPHDLEALDAVIALLERAGRHEELAQTLARRAEAVRLPLQRRADRVRLARILAERLDRPAEAIDCWLSIRREFGDAPDVTEALDALLEGAGRHDELAQILTHAATAARTHHVALFRRLGELYAGPLEAPVEALPWLSAALLAAPDDEGARAAMRRLLAHPRVAREAAEALARAYEAAGEWRAVVEVLDQLLAGARDRAEQASLLRRAARLHLERGHDAASALGCLCRALPLEPDNLATEAEMMRLAEQTDRFTTVAASLRMAAENAPGARAAELRRVEGAILERLGEAQAALAAYRGAVARRPDDLEALEAIVRCAARAGAWDEAAQAVVAVASLRDRVPVELVAALEGLVGSLADDWAALASSLSLAIGGAALGPSVAQALELLAARWFRDRIGDRAAAIRAAERAVRIPGSTGTGRAEALALSAELQRAAASDDLVETLLAIDRLDDTSLDALREAAEVSLGKPGAPWILERLHRKAAAMWLRDEQASGRVDAPSATRWSLDRLLEHALGEAEDARGSERAIAAMLDATRLPLEPDEKVALQRRAGELLVASGQRGRAIDVYRAVVAERPRDVEALQRIASLCEEEGRLAEALALRLREIDLVDDPARRLELRLAHARLTGGLEAQGGRVASLRANLADHPGHEASLDELAKVLEERGKYAELAEILSEQASELERRGEREAAANLFARLAALAEGPLGDRGRAVEAHGRVVDLDARAESIDALARLHLESEPAAAACWLERRLELTAASERVSVLLRLARARIRAGERDAAVASLGKAFDEAPRNAEVRKLLIEIYRQGRDHEALAETLSRAALAVSDERTVLAYAREAATLYAERLGTPERAVPVLSKAVELAPDDRALKLILAEGLRVAGELDRARALLEELVAGYGRRRSVERAHTHLALSRVFHAQGDDPRALDELDVAASMAPGDATILVTLAELASESGQLDRAERAYRTLLVSARRESGLPVGPAEILFQLSHLAALRGHDDKAREFAESALEALIQRDDEAPRVQAKLRAHGDWELLERVLRRRLDHVDAAHRRAQILAELADLLAARDRARDALAARLAAVKTDPSSPLHHQAAWDAASAAGDLDAYVSVVEALLSDERADRSPHVRCELLLRLGALLENERGDLDRAAALYAQAEGTGVRTVDVWRALARVAGQRGDGATQMRLLEQLANLGEAEAETRSDALFRLAEVQLASPETLAEGLANLEKALAEDSRAERAALVLRPAADMHHDSAALLEIYEQVARRSGDDETLLHFLARRAASAAATVEQVKEAVDLARRLERLDEAEQLMLRAAEIGKNGAREGDLAAVDWALLGLAERRMAQGDLPAAVRWLVEAAEVADVDAVFARAETLAELAAAGDLTVAAKLYERLLERAPTDRRAWQPLAEICGRLGDVERLERIVEETLDGLSEPGERNALRIALGRALLAHEERRGDAVGVLERVLLDDPGAHEAEALLVAHLEERGDREALVALLERQLRRALDAGDPAAVGRASLALAERLEEIEAAADLLRRAREVAPEDPALIEALLARVGDDGERARLLAILLEVGAPERAGDRALELAAIQRRLGDEEAEVAALEAGLERTPDHDGVREALLRRHRERGDHTGLARVLVATAERSGESATRARLLREAARVRWHDLGDPATAAALFRQASELCPEELELRVDLALSLGAAGMHEEAVEVVTAAIELAPEPVHLVRVRADLHAAAGHDDASLADLERAFAGAPALVAPDLEEALLRHLETAISAGDRKRERALTLRAVDVMLARGERARASNLLGSYTRRAHDDVEALRRLREIDTVDGRWEAVAEICGRLIHLETGAAQVDAALGLSHAHHELGAPEAAREGLEHVRAAQAAPQVRSELRRIYAKLGDQRQLARLLIEDAVELADPGERAELLGHAGKILVDLGEAEAIAPLEEAVRLAPGASEPVVTLADAYVLAGRLDDADQLLDEALASTRGRRTPEMALYHHRKAHVAGQRGELSAQLELLQEAHACNKKNGVVAAALADLAEQLGDLELAAKTLRTITLIESDCPIGRAEAFLRQGRIAKRQGDDKNARMWARRAKREAPDDPEIDAFLAAVGERGVPGRG